MPRVSRLPTPMNLVAEFLGKAHPVILHFPLAFLIAAGALETVRIFRDSPFLGRAALWLLALGAITAVLAMGSGWLLASHEHIRSDERTILTWHRWLGVATAAISTVAWVIALRPREGMWKAARRSLTILVAVLVIATGYFGGELVWGRDWFQPDRDQSG